MPIEKICQRCGKTFFIKPSRIDTAKYCSIECRSPAIYKACRQCNKKFRVKPGYADNRHYCSAACYHESRKGQINLDARRKRIKLICETCRQLFDVPPSAIKYRDPRFCSTECFYKWLKGSERAQYLDVKCQTCDKPIHVLASRYTDGRGRYCSQRCMMIDRPKPPKCEMLKRICPNCGIEFEIYPSWAREEKKRFCSHPCLTSYQGSTSIEQLLLDEFDRRAIKYYFQYPINRWTIDIALPDDKIAIEADGIYWHSLPHVIERDTRKDADLQSQGWTVLRFTGDEIRESPQRCVDEIVKLL